MPPALSPHQKAQAIKTLEIALDFVKELPSTTRCTDCVYHSAGSCKKWGEMIPADILEEGCEEWKFDKFTPPF